MSVTALLLSAGLMASTSGVAAAQDRPSADPKLAYPQAASAARDHGEWTGKLTAALASEQKDPYRGLFRGQVSTLDYQGFSGTVATSARVVCGLTVIQGDPAVDPRMVRMEPDPKVEFKIHQITPTVCHDERADRHQ